MAIKTPYRNEWALDNGETKPALGDVTMNNDGKNKLKKFYSQKSLSIKNINAWKFGEIKTLAIITIGG